MGIHRYSCMYLTKQVTDCKMSVLYAMTVKCSIYFPTCMKCSILFLNLQLMISKSNILTKI